MTIELDRRPSVFDAGLPTVDYEHLHDPEEAHALFHRARAQAPIALGPPPGSGPPSRRSSPNSSRR